MQTVRVFAAIAATALAYHWAVHAAVPERVGDFTLRVVTDDVPTARQMAESPDGVLFVGSFDAGRVYAVVPVEDGEPEVVIVDSGLRRPSGIVLRGPDLYVAAMNRILRYANISDGFRNSPEPTVVTDSLPAESHHGWKYLVFGPDGFLYVPVGAPCNICERTDDERFATILRMDPDTGETTVYAQGVRNSVGMAWHERTGELWFSENGRDWLGDDLPADEINRVTTPGAHYGYPYIHAGDVADPAFGQGKDPADYVSPEVDVQAQGTCSLPERHSNRPTRCHASPASTPRILSRHSEDGTPSRHYSSLSTATLPHARPLRHEPVTHRNGPAHHWVCARRHAALLHRRHRSAVGTPSPGRRRDFVPTPPPNATTPTTC